MSEILTYLTTNEDRFRKGRLAALYSDFRHLRTINPDGYNANIEAWRQGLTDAAKSGHTPARGSVRDLLLLKVDEELLGALETKEWGRPLALGTVIRDAIARKEMIPMQEFFMLKESIYNKSWVISPWQIFSWGLRQLGLGGGEQSEDKLPVGKLVIISNVESAARGVLEQSNDETSWVGRIYSRKLFYQKFESALGTGHPISEADLDVLLKFLARDKETITYDGQTIKFKGSMDTRAPAITQEDTTVASLKTLISDLELQVTMLNNKTESLSISAREAVAKKNRVAALAALRSKKLAEINFSRQSAVLGQLEEVYAKIGQAADQVEVVRIMEGSTGVLKSLNKQVGGVERVDDVVDQLKDQMTQVDEVSSIIAEVGDHASVVDESEVDDELEVIEQEEKRKEAEAESKAKEQREQEEIAETRRKVDQLPSVEGEIKSKDDMKDKHSESKQESELLEESTQELQRLSL